MQAKCDAKNLEREGGDQVALADNHERQAPNDAVRIRLAENCSPAERDRIDLGYVAHERGVFEEKRPHVGASLAHRSDGGGLSCSLRRFVSAAEPQDRRHALKGRGERRFIGRQQGELVHDR